MKEELISVIIPVYNCESYVARCLDSVRNNTYKNLEIICVNDGSTDGSLCILGEYKKRDDRIQMFSKENGGLSSARNKGMEHATGKYVAFVDADDWIHPQYFEILYRTIQKGKTDAVICNQLEVNDMLPFYEYQEEECLAKETIIPVEELFQSKKYNMSRVYAHGVLYEKNKIANQFPVGVKVIEDNIFNMLNLLRYDKITIIDLPIYFYFVNTDSIMHTFKCEDAFHGLEWICNYLIQGDEKDEKIVLEMVNFVYKRCLYYRYDFTVRKQKVIAFQSAQKCYRSIVKTDDCLPFWKRLIYRSCYHVPILYSFFKSIKKVLGA